MNRADRPPLCMIPARGGSKRFPRKNIAPFAGKPLLAWTVEAALGSGVFDTVFVSSEDEEILRIAETHGATPLPRERDFAEDAVTVVELCQHTVEQFEKRGQPVDAVYVLLPTSPLRRSETIKRAWAMFVEQDADALLSVVPLDHPPEWSLAVRKGYVVPKDAARYETNRLALEPAYRHDGGHAIARAAYFKKTDSFLGPRTLSFEAPRDETADIDEPLDLQWAEFLLARRSL